jgi:hypothetical protein
MLDGVVRRSVAVLARWDVCPPSDRGLVCDRPADLVPAFSAAAGRAFVLGYLTRFEVEERRQLAQETTGEFAHIGVSVVALDGDHLDQGPARPDFEGDGVGGTGEMGDDGPDVAEGVLEGIERPDARSEDRAVADPQQFLADVEGDGVVSGNEAGRVEQGDCLKERGPLVGVTVHGEGSILRGQVQGLGQTAFAGVGPYERDQRLDDGS